MAYKDWKYFVSEAKKIVDAESVRYERGTSGLSKGQYFAKMGFIKYEEGMNISQYLLKKYGCDIKYYTGSSYATKEEAKEKLEREVAGSLVKCHKSTVNHPLSELWEYWLKNKEGADIYFDSEIGRDVIDYFNILNGDVNQYNWKDYKYNKPYDGYGSKAPQTLTSYKEFYFYIKNKAKEEYLNKISHWYTNSKDVPKTFIWDQEKIPQILEIETSFEAKPISIISQSDYKKVELNNSIPNSGVFKVGYRKQYFDKTPILVGRQRPIILASGEKHDSQYAIVELSEILASHNERTFETTPDYPLNIRGENINDRNYSQDKNAQAKVLELAQNFEPEIQISTSVGPSGLPIITVDGVVISGNNRTMSMKILVEDFKENYLKYLQVLAREISSFGFAPHIGSQLIIGDKISLPESSYNNPLSVKFKQPFLVRIDPDFPEYTTTEMAKYNKDTKKSERPIDKAIKLSSILLDNQGCFNGIANLVGKYEVFSDFYNSPSDIKLLQKYLLECNIITENELNNYFQATTMTNGGKDFLENLLAGMVLNKEALLASEVPGVKQYKQKLITSLPVLVKNANLPEGSLSTELQDAIILEQKIASSGSDFKNYFSQYGLNLDDSVTKKYSKKALIMNRFLQRGVKIFKSSLEAYNQSILDNQGESLFGEKPTVDEIFNTYIVSKLEPYEIDIINKNSLLLQDKPIKTEKIEVKDTVQPKIDKLEGMKKRLQGLKISLKLISDNSKRLAVEKRVKALEISIKMAQK